MGLTLIEKIVNRYTTGLAPNATVRSGDYVSIRPRHVMTHDNTAAVIPKFQKIGATRIHDTRQPVFCLDHDIQNLSPENLGKYARIEAFAKAHGIAFYKAGSGIGHQIMVEEGFVVPGSFVVASDSHSNLYGGAAALGTPVVRTDAAVIWATGQTWWEIPPIARVELVGELQPGVVGKDVIIALCGKFNKDEVLNYCCEFVGEGVHGLSVDQRLTIANMTTEWGALAGVFPFDEPLRDYLYGRADLFAKRGDDPPRYGREDIDRWYADRLLPDDDALYARELILNISQVTPHVAGPNEVKTITPLPEIESRRVKVDRAYLLSCVNARLEDLTEAAQVLKDTKVADHVKFYVAAASASVEEEARNNGVWETLVRAGAVTLPPGCGPCIGLGEGTLEAGEVGISATNRNFQGRMGSRDASVYLASPAVVAASAVAGYIAGPRPIASERIDVVVRDRQVAVSQVAQESIVGGFPRELAGRLLYLPKDNLNTDGIYGKDFTYRDNLSHDEMGRAAMLNYDPAFQEIAREGDIIAGGRNFGSGSSREQAATALAFRGIRMVVAASFSQTYKRNAFNNGFIVVECSALIDELSRLCKREIQAGRRTIDTASEVVVAFVDSTISFRGKRYRFAPLGSVPQRLIAIGGAEAMIRSAIQGSGTANLA